MGVVDAYMFVCRFLAEATDGAMDEMEWNSMVLSLAAHTRGLGHTAKDWQEAVDRSRAAYHEILAREGPGGAVAQFRSCVVELRHFWSEDPETLQVLVKEFWRRARIDGHLHPMEEHFIHEVERAWLRKEPHVDAAAW